MRCAAKAASCCSSTCRAWPSVRRALQMLASGKRYECFTKKIADFFLEVEKMTVDAGKNLTAPVGRDCLRSYLATELVDSEDVFVDYLASLKDRAEVEEAQMMVDPAEPGVPKPPGPEVPRHPPIAGLLGRQEAEATDRTHQTASHPSRQPDRRGSLTRGPQGLCDDCQAQLDDQFGLLDSRA